MHPALPSPDRPQLDYAPPLPWRKTPAARKGLIGFVVLVVTVLGWLVGPELWMRMRILDLQRECLDYGPLTLAYLEGEHALVVQKWSQFEALSTSSAPSADTIAFLHELRSPGGNRRLVAVEIVEWTGASTAPSVTPKFVLETVVYQPGTILRRPIQILNTSNGLCIGRPVAIYFGIPDAMDASHFTIRVREAGGIEKIYDGWLQDDDTVLIEERITPATVPASAPAAGLTGGR